MFLKKKSGPVGLTFSFFTYKKIMSKKNGFNAKVGKTPRAFSVAWPFVIIISLPVSYYLPRQLLINTGIKIISFFEGCCYSTFSSQTFACFPTNISRIDRVQILKAATALM